MKKQAPLQTAKTNRRERERGARALDGALSPARRLRMGALRMALAGTLAIGIAGMAACSTGAASSNDAGGNTASSQSSNSSGSAQANIETDTASMDFDYSNRDYDASYDAGTATTIELADGSAAVTGSGATVDGGTVTITEEGTYVVSGSSADAQITVAASDDAKVQIVLNGVTMTCADGPCIYVQNADKVFLTLADGSANELSDGASWALTGADGEANATIYSTCDLTINGSGSLTVDATVDNGINSRDDVTITDGDITVNAAGNAIRGNDKVQVGGGTLTLTAGEDGLKSANEEDDDAGFVSIDGGSVTIDAGDDGIDAARYIRINDGTVTINAGDDALHSDRDLAILGGTVTIDAGDDAVHGEYNVWVAGGTLTVNSCNEGLEGQNIDVTGGENTINSTDDSLNASAAGSGNTQTASASGQDGQATPAVASPGTSPAGMDVQEECGILISGGTLELVSSSGDSIDSNGSISVTGGTVYVSGTTRGDNGIIDSGTTASISGGTVLGLGAQGMQESFGTDSSQASIVVTGVSGQAGDAVAIEDSEDNVIASYIASNDFSWVIASDPDMIEGETYTLLVNGQAVATATASVEQASTQAGAAVPGAQGGTAAPNDSQRGNGGMPGVPGSAPGQTTAQMTA